MNDENRLTAACAADMQADAPHLAMCLAEGPDDAATYSSLSRQDADGNLYAVASFPASAMTQDPTKTLQRPAWDKQPYTINMAAARRAQAALVVWDREGPIPQAAPGQITIVGGMRGPEALAKMGLALLPVPDDDDLI